jgi:hypothetical protein
MEAAPLYSDPCQGRVQAATQDVALAERLSIPRAENVSAPVPGSGKSELQPQRIPLETYCQIK